MVNGMKLFLIGVGLFLFGLVLLSYKTAIVGHIVKSPSPLTNETSKGVVSTPQAAETSQSNLINTLVELTGFVTALTGLIGAIAGLVRAIKSG